MLSTLLGAVEIREKKFCQYRFRRLEVPMGGNFEEGSPKALTSKGMLGPTVSMAAGGPLGVAEIL